ncbi:MAG: carboxypeptidase-like regulatory domain-containing protein [Marinilabiliales bacterium]|nr:carboxypeptidase-like regulatory domain-containing protein [Marinilabiliales bacterium]
MPRPWSPGKVYDRQSNEPLAGSSCHLTARGAGTSTDETGFYSFAATPGRFAIDIQICRLQASSRRYWISLAGETAGA